MFAKVCGLVLLAVALVNASSLRSGSREPAKRFSKHEDVHRGHGYDSERAVPTAVDWREKGIVSPVHDQGQIASSGLFAVLDALESLHAMEHHDHLEYASVKEMLDCCGSEAHLLDDPFQCVKNVGGLCSASSYKPEEGQCRNATCEPMFKFSHISHILQNSEKSLESAVSYQPVVVALDAADAAFRDYQGGVLVDVNCSQTRLDHSMLAVGYGQTEQGMKYWILKNSWGINWGESGYLRLAKDHNNMCGVASDAVFPLAI